MTELGSERVAALPGGLESIDHWKVSGSPSRSDEPLPSSVTVLPRATDWSGPAFATGRTFSVSSITVSGAESTVPSFTMSCTT